MIWRRNDFFKTGVAPACPRPKRSSLNGVSPALTLHLVSAAAVERTGLLQLFQQLLALILQLGGETQIDGEDFAQASFHGLCRCTERGRGPDACVSTRSRPTLFVPGPDGGVWKRPPGLSSARSSGEDGSLRPCSRPRGPDGVFLDT